MLAVDGHVFISYVREDADRVDRLQAILEAAGVRVWRDTANLWPGEDWRFKIRQAVTDEALVFLACFSNHSAARSTSGQNEELNLAVDQLRLRRPDQPWLIPVRFDDCEVPNFEIGGDRTFRSIQRVDLIGDSWDSGLARLLPSVLGILGTNATSDAPAQVSAHHPARTDALDVAPARARGSTGRRTLRVETRFQDSVLWCKTLAVQASDDPYGVERERLRVSYLSLRDRVAGLLAELPRGGPGYTSQFTPQDVSHIDALWESASLICGDAETLNPAEGYVLGCAFAFHDAAMGLVAYGDDVEVIGGSAWRDLASVAFVEVVGRWPDDDDLDDLPADVLHACVAKAVRQTHSARAAALVEEAEYLASGADVPFVSDPQLRQAYVPLIGQLAASHWHHVDDLESQFGHQRGSLPWQPADWTIDPLKLACILRLGDAALLDSPRAPSFLFTLSDARHVSQDHWWFQGYIGRPQLADDRISYSSMRPFSKQDAEAWWLALDYLRAVDRELKRVDSFLHDLHKPRLAARGVRYVDRPERFADVFPVSGWRPVDADVQISDVRGLVTALGGEQLYGQAPAVAVRELIQNAQDAVLARQAIDPDFDNPQVVVSLEQHGDEWTLEVRDNGIGMDEDILARGLLDFGATGWRSDAIRSKFAGLASSGFRPRGTFGIGFYSVFMLGDDVTVTTRRFDAGQAEARQLKFNGLANRPILTGLPPETRLGSGTLVHVRLTSNPTDAGGLLRTEGIDELGVLLQWLVPSNAVPIASTEEPGRHGRRRHTLDPLELASASPDDVFERLYPPHEYNWVRGAYRVQVREEFCEQVTEMVDADGRRLGLAALGSDISILHGNDSRARGVVVVNGFRADRHHRFAGYLCGRPSRASRDNVELACTTDQLAAWIVSQVQRMRDRGRFNPSIQLELAELLYRATGRLDEDHHVAMTAEGLQRVGDIETWGSEHDHIFMANYGPIDWEIRPPGLWHRTTGTAVTLPDHWIYQGPQYWFEFIAESMLPDRGDAAYAKHEHDKELTWQKRWWQMSRSFTGIVIERLCRAWSCKPGDLLAPVAERGWDDYADPGIPGIPSVPGLHLHRP